MSKLVYSALALTLVSAPGIASDKEWSSLDQDIENLSSSLAAQKTGGPKLGGYILTSYRHSSDEPLQVGGEDRSGFFMEKARIEVSGDINDDYSYKVSVEVGSSDKSDNPNPGDTGVTIRDAYVNFRIAEGVNGRMGRFKQPFNRYSLISSSRQLFLDRTALGELFRGRDLGLMVFGNFDTIDYYLAAQNGSDGAADEHLFTGRVQANVLGGGVGKVEGAYGAGDETRLSVGAAVQEDGTLDDGLNWTIDAAMTQGPFSISGELVDFDDGDDGAGYGFSHPYVELVGGATDIADTTPWSAQASYMFTEMYELAVRYEDADDDDDTRSYGAVVNRYVQGHDIKWLVQWVRIESDAGAAEDVDEFGLGLGVTF